MARKPKTDAERIDRDIQRKAQNQVSSKMSADKRRADGFVRCSPWVPKDCVPLMKLIAVKLDDCVRDGRILTTGQGKLDSGLAYLEAERLAELVDELLQRALLEGRAGLRMFRGQHVADVAGSSAGWPPSRVPAEEESCVAMLKLTPGGHINVGEQWILTRSHKFCPFAKLSGKTLVELMAALAIGPTPQGREALIEIMGMIDAKLLDGQGP